MSEQGAVVDAVVAEAEAVIAQPASRIPASERAIRRISTDQLATELQRRGLDRDRALSREGSPRSG